VESKGSSWNQICRQRTFIFKSVVCVYVHLHELHHWKGLRQGHPRNGKHGAPKIGAGLKHILLLSVNANALNYISGTWEEQLFQFSPTGQYTHLSYSNRAQSESWWSMKDEERATATCWMKRVLIDNHISASARIILPFPNTSLRSAQTIFTVSVLFLLSKIYFECYVN